MPPNTDQDASWKDILDSYFAEFMAFFFPKKLEEDFELSFKFPSVKLLDYNKDWVALEANPNPFAVVTMAYLKAQQGKTQSGEDQVESKLGLVRTSQ